MKKKTSKHMKNLAKKYTDKKSVYSSMPYFSYETYKNMCGAKIPYRKDEEGSPGFWIPYWEDNFDKVFVLKEKLKAKAKKLNKEFSVAYKELWDQIDIEFPTKNKKRRISIYDPIENVTYEYESKNYAIHGRIIEPESLLKVHRDSNAENSTILYSEKLNPYNEKVRKIHRKESQNFLKIGKCNLVIDIIIKNIYFEKYTKLNKRLYQEQMIKINLNLPHCDYLLVRMNDSGGCRVIFKEDILELSL